MMSDQVECRSDFEYPQRPVAFYWHDQRLEVAEVLSQNRNPVGYTFLVCNESLGIFKLDYDIHTDQWYVKQL
jgi:hypothetical protein